MREREISSREVSQKVELPSQRRKRDPI